MLIKTDDFLKNEFGISAEIFRAVEKAESEVAGRFEELDDIAAYNQYKVLAAFQKNRIADMHFSYNTGYGYDDPGREAIEKVYADVFHTEAALCRPTIVNGTHALSLVLQGILRPGDELIYATGTPYDTLLETIGIGKHSGRGSLIDFGVKYRQIELKEDGNIDLEALKNAISPATRMVTIQRSTGYGWRPAITVDKIAEAVKAVKSVRSDIVIMIDNSYGEFLDKREATDVGADVVAASLIKNPGGGLALTGGYCAGRADLIELISYRMTTPGIGGECGLMFDQTRTMLQGLFQAPRVVNGAVKGAILCGQVFKNLGYEVCPDPFETRSDIIQAVRLGTPEAVVAFCKGIQAAAPVDSFVTPEPWDMPGYPDQVVMAAGAFIQGSSIELSADAPIREPYNVYFQGGLTYEHSKFGVLMALRELNRRGLLSI